MKYFRPLFLAFCLIIIAGFTGDKKGFESIQKSFARVSTAYSDKEEVINEKCRALGIPEADFGNIFIRAFKQERTLEVWVQKPDGKYVLFNQFRVYSNAGKLGPKRAQGDYQVPEGFYYITEFNPYSSYYLSLGLNYPNESDCELSGSCKKGGNIFIHGSVVSSGCLAMSDYYIEDIYVCCVKARNRGQQKIPVQIYPFKMTEENLESYTQLEEFKPHAKFWRNLAEGYRIFENNCCLPQVNVGPDGYYQFSDASTAEVSK
jgi:murein L,D-transpeptidase YafK